MTATAGSFAHDTFASDPSDPDGPIFRNSPPMTAYRPRLEPSPSPPPAIPLPKVSSPPSPGRKASNGKKKVPPSQGDAVLVHYLDGGRRPEIAARAGAEPLDGGYIDDEDCVEEEEEEEEEDDDDGGESHDSSMSGYIGSPKMSPDPRPTNGSVDLKSLAGGALAALALQPPTTTTTTMTTTTAREESPKVADAQDDGLEEQVRSPEIAKSQEQQLPAQPPPPPQPPPQHPQLQPLQPRDSAQKPGLAMPITPYTPNGPDFFSPRLPSASGLRHPDIMSPIPTPNSHGELPPIMASPKSEASGHISQPSLPSIRAQVGDLLVEQHYPDKDVGRRHSSFPHSPPGLPRMSIIPGITSPTSPNYPYAHSMPSPATSMYGHYGSYSNGNGYTPRHPSDYSSAASHHSEASGMEQTSMHTPLSQDPRDRMSIDHVTNSQIGQFICKFPNCNAAPFQTQYLLNSHANVHSSARPHYCPVKGCPRAEGGKGFKRKNEMIRHGLVHESPGYVCPFCPDREHKYPRPDNLQRHVRVHHMDKDKDDPELREVLAQRPDGPNRGRRRRGVP
ncbi:C2H2 type zinc finger protein [Seiridium cupressi]